MNPAHAKTPAPSHQNRLQAETLRAAVLAPGGMVEQMKRMGLDRSLRSLKQIELDTIATGTIGAWIVARAAITTREFPNSLEAFLAEMQPQTPLADLLS